MGAENVSMSDELRILLERLHDDGRDTSGRVSGLVEEMHRAHLALGRVETRMVELLDRMAHVERVEERVATIERSATWVRAWSAGAAAAVVAVFGAVAWIASKLPAIVAAVGR